MFKKIWGIAKENFATFLAITTTVITVIYTALRFLLYIYWSGYFNELNIDGSFMNLNFDGFIFQVAFVTALCTLVFYFLSMAEGFFKKVEITEENNKSKWYVKIWRLLINVLSSFFLSAVFMSFANIPLVICMCVLMQWDLTFLNMLFGVGFLYIVEVMMLLVKEICEEDDFRREERMVTRILALMIFSCLTLALVYYVGSRSVETENKIRLVEEGKYAITYCDGERYILHKVVIEDGKAIIFRNEQKVISIDGCESTVVPVLEIEVSN